MKLIEANSSEITCHTVPLISQTNRQWAHTHIQTDKQIDRQTGAQNKDIALLVTAKESSIADDPAV